jgi:alpha-L-fucosidase
MTTLFEPTWESLCRYEVPDWYQDGKFGIFIHWGLYCVPAFGNEWYPRNMYRQGTKEFEHHVATYGPHTQFGYKDFIPQFRAEQFDAGQWAALFKRAGARFVVPVAEHHDGFAMYDSDCSRWTAAKMGPRRDIIGQLAEATRQEGMVFGVSSHRAEHWWFMNGGRTFPSDVQDPAYADFYGPAVVLPDDHHNKDAQPRPDAKYLEDWLGRCCEIIDKYHPQLFWFDWWIEQVIFTTYLQRFASYYYNRAAEWNKGVAINYKYHAYPEGAAVLDIERGQLNDIRPLFWQNDTSVSKNSWGYVQNHDYKTSTSIVHDLLDVISKNGALLLNIGPKPDGTIPQPEVAMLEEIGAWLKMNGEAVYGTRPWKVFGEGPTEVAEGAFTDTKRAAFTAQDMRFTAKPDALYATIMDWPGAKTTIRSFKAGCALKASAIARVTMLGVDQPLSWQQDADGLTVQLPAEPPCRHAYVVKVWLKG